MGARGSLQTYPPQDRPLTTLKELRPFLFLFTKHYMSQHSRPFWGPPQGAWTRRKAAADGNEAGSVKTAWVGAKGLWVSAHQGQTQGEDQGQSQNQGQTHTQGQSQQSPACPNKTAPCLQSMTGPVPAWRFASLGRPLGAPSQGLTERSTSTRLPQKTKKWGGGRV